VHAPPTERRGAQAILRKGCGESRAAAPYHAPMPALLVSHEVRRAPPPADRSSRWNRPSSADWGLPDGAGADALRRSIGAVTRAGAVPALTEVLDGVAGSASTGRVRRRARRHAQGGRARPARAVAQRWPAAATTVSASVALAAAAGIAVFATGAIGGVHRDWAETGDESADLGALARHPVVTVCAGAKSFLHLGRTLERLETLGCPSSGSGPMSSRPSTPQQRAGRASSGGLATEAASVVRAARALGYRGGVLVASPVSEDDELPAPRWSRSWRQRWPTPPRRCHRRCGHAVGPGAVAAGTGGRTVAATSPWWRTTHASRPRSPPPSAPASQPGHRPRLGGLNRGGARRCSPTGDEPSKEASCRRFHGRPALGPADRPPPRRHPLPGLRVPPARRRRAPRGRRPLGRPCPPGAGRPADDVRRAARDGCPGRRAYRRHGVGRATGSCCWPSTPVEWVVGFWATLAAGAAVVLGQCLVE